MNNNVIQIVETNTPDGQETMLVYRCRQFEADASTALCGLGEWGPWRRVPYHPLDKDGVEPDLDSDMVVNPVSLAGE